MKSCSFFRGLLNRRLDGPRHSAKSSHRVAVSGLVIQRLRMLRSPFSGQDMRPPATGSASWEFRSGMRHGECPRKIAVLILPENIEEAIPGNIPSVYVKYREVGGGTGAPDARNRKSLGNGCDRARMDECERAGDDCANIATCQPGRVWRYGVGTDCAGSDAGQQDLHSPCGD